MQQQHVWVHAVARGEGAAAWAHAWDTTGGLEVLNNAATAAVPVYVHGMMMMKCNALGFFECKRGQPVALQGGCTHLPQKLHCHGPWGLGVLTYIRKRGAA